MMMLLSVDGHILPGVTHRVEHCHRPAGRFRRYITTHCLGSISIALRYNCARFSRRTACNFYILLFCKRFSWLAQHMPCHALNPHMISMCVTSSKCEPTPTTKAGLYGEAR